MTDPVRQVVRRAFVALIRLVNHLVPKRRQAVVALYPDYESSTGVLLDGLRRQHIDVVVAQERPDPAWAPGPGARVVRLGSPASLWDFLRSRWLFFSHPRFIGMTCRRQRVVNLWHGMPIKAIQLLDDNDVDAAPVPSDLTVSSSELFAPLLAAAFGVPAETVRVLPHPRWEALVRTDGRDALRRLGVDAEPGQTVLAWLPTFRGRMHADGSGIAPGLRLTDGFVRQLSELLERCNGLLLLRRHPYEAAEAPVHAERIVEVRDADLRAARLGVYEMLAGVDALISDSSSVWIDFLVRDRPTLIYFPDLDEYTAERALLLSPFDAWTPSPILADEDQLLAELEAVLAGADRHRARRQRISGQLIGSRPENSVDTILAAVESAARRRRR